MRLGFGVGRIVTLVVVLALGIAGQARAAAVFDLGLLVPAGLNAKDQVVGNIYDSNAQNAVPHAGLWSNGVLTALPEQAGATQSDAYAINDAGRIAGADRVPAQSAGYDVHAIFWDGTGAPTQIGPLASFGPGSDFSEATSVDAAGDVVGYTVTQSQDQPPQFRLTGFLRKNDGSLLTAGRGDSGANGTSNVGTITADGSLLLGSAVVQNSSEAYLWSGASPNAPGVHLDFQPVVSGFTLLGGPDGLSFIMNDLASDGTVLGYRDSSGSPPVRTFYIRLPTGAETQITGLGGVNAVNAKHVVAGTIQVSNTIHAAIWKNGAVTDLNTLLPANSGFTLADALAINDNGDVVGLAIHNNQQVGFLLKLGIEAENIEITQGIQKDTWDAPTTIDAPGFGATNGGSYTGVPLVTDVPTVVRVYASAPTSQPQPPQGVPAELHAYIGPSGALSELAGSPISASPRKLEVGPVLPQVRLDPAGAYTFTLPAAWTERGPLTLVADVNPAAAGAPKCSKCGNVYALSGIGFKTTEPVTLRPFQIIWKYPDPGGHGFTMVKGPDQSSLFQRARDVLPLAQDHLIVQPFPQAVLDISAQVQRIVSHWRGHNHVALSKPDLSDCHAISLCGGDIVSAEYDAVRRTVDLAHSGHTYLAGFDPSPPSGSTWPDKGFTIVGPDAPPRPLTDQTHELLHLLLFEHASLACGGGTGGQIGVPWPPDELGYIQGIGLDRRPDSGGKGLYKIIAPGVGQPQWYDLMSYCNRGKEAVAWISTINWTKLVHDDAAPGSAADAPAPLAATSAAGTNMAVDAAIQPGGQATILGASGTTGAPTPSQPSPFQLKVLGSHGNVISSVGVAPERITESAVQMFAANVPARGATTVELTDAGHVLTKLRKPSPSPSVRLIAPRGGFKAGHHKLAIGWRAKGARGATVTATIQYETSRAQGWQTLAAGLTGQSYSVPLAMLNHATRVHLRVVIGDGFSDAVATSGLIRLPRR